MAELMDAAFEVDDAAPPFLFLRFAESPSRETWAEALAATEARLTRANGRA